MSARRELQACYSSSHVDVIAAWRETQRRWDEYHKAVKAFCADYPDHSAWERKSTTGAQFIGLGGSKPGPEWRWERDCWVPYKSKQKGNPELWKRVNNLRAKFAQLPGMPNDVFHGFSIASPAWNYWDGVMWVCWTQPHDAVQADLEIWDLRKVSEYYAAKEAAAESDDA